MRWDEIFETNFLKCHWIFKMSPVICFENVRVLIMSGACLVYVVPFVASKHPSASQHSLFGCCNDIRLTCTTMFCPCIVAGRNAAAVDESCLLCGLLSLVIYDNVCVYSNAIIRGRIREKFGIDGSAIDDCLVACCCMCCACVQHAQEIKTRQPPEHEEIDGTRKSDGPV